MARPVSKELTDGELEVMHVFWKRGEITASEARDELAKAGHDLAYVTVANLARILIDKGFLEATNKQRPFRYRPVKSFDEVSRSLLGDLMERVFQGSREQLLVNLFGRRKKLSAKERNLLEQILKEQAS
jgi:predicted transcriptional regulator